ncbi:M91 family zinc metallopeptidase, partial [Pseudomonas coronafaciens]|uniref:M91 family zinc metallopeptidase n=1 Tax=Pseudomonas coronafaciens TaxID=53409 RepID=UPI001C112F14
EGTALFGHQTPLSGEHSRLNGCPVSLDHYTHELIHAKHHLAGTLKYGGEVTRSASSASTPSGKEELRAVGLGKYANSGEPSENSIRQEHGLPLRRTYARSGNW